MALTKKERRALGLYVREIADRIELRDWTIAIAHAPCDDHLEANINVTPGTRHATISFHPDTDERSAAELRETVVHELIHAHIDVCWKMVQTDLAEALGKPTYYVFCDAYRRNMELSVDGLAKALAKHMPLIDWSAK